jgi:hypothetical protein
MGIRFSKWRRSNIYRRSPRSIAPVTLKDRIIKDIKLMDIQLSDLQKELEIVKNELSINKPKVYQNQTS